MHYDFVPLPARKPLAWPNGARLALIVTFNLEFWDLLQESEKTYYAGGPGILPDPLPGNVPDWPNYSWREYGQRVGIWRMIDVMDKAGVPATCTMNAKTGLERRAIIDAVNERGWEIVAHNFVQSDLLTNYEHEPEKERELIRTSLRVYEDVVGRPARGWLSSSLRSTTRTADICAEEGLVFFSDIMNDDQPYLLHTDRGRMVAVPYSAEMIDFMMFMRRGNSVDEAIAVWKEQFDVLYAEGAESGRLMTIGLHPHLVGYPFRIRALREFVDYAKQFDGVWWAKREEIADWYLETQAG